jgi:hypothetical protein
MIEPHLAPIANICYVFILLKYTDTIWISEKRIATQLGYSGKITGYPGLLTCDVTRNKLPAGMDHRAASGLKTFNKFRRKGARAIPREECRAEKSRSLSVSQNLLYRSIVSTNVLGSIFIFSAGSAMVRPSEGSGQQQI